VKNIVLAPVSYGIELESVPDEPYFTAVQGPKKIDMKVAAKLAGVTEEEFVALNPAHNKPVASGTGTFIVPLDKADDFEANLRSYDKPLVSWTTYQARRYEAMDAIARRHNLTTVQLKAANPDLKLDKKNRLRVASAVMVPMPKGAAPQTVRVAQVTPVPAMPAPVRTASTLRLYTVRTGDTIYGIAQRYKTAVETLLNLNQLSASTILQPGLKLRLP
jgi:membrane-bound lytic murein transglycosylase D